MKNTRRNFIKTTTAAAAALPLLNLKLSAMESGVVVTPAASGGILREVLFSPGNITEKNHCYDRFELLKKPAQNPVMTAQMPWEGGGGINWGSVLRSADGKFKFFYCTDFPGVQEGAVLVDNSMQGKNHCVVCYAESDDGLTWHRPALNLYFQEKFPDNNIIFAWAAYYNDASTVLEDLHDPDPSRRYKMSLFHIDTKDNDLTGVCLFVSPDGLHWTFTGTVLPSQDASSIWQDKRTGRYYAFLKDRLGGNRSRMLMHSDDFKHWSEPQWIFTPDHGDSAGTNFYNQSAFVMAGRTLGFLNLYDLTTQTTWVELVESGDNINWRRMPSRPRILSPGAPGTYDSGGAYVGLAEPILIGEEYRYYYYASSDRHDVADTGGNPAQKPSLAYATFHKNRLVGQQTEGDGYFATLPFVCPGGRLFLNFIGKSEVTVCIKRPGYGGDYVGFSLAECIPVTGDSLRQEIIWKNHANLDELKGKYIRIKVAGKNLVGYSAALEA
ncbi:MAG: twin-arginine translocation signal domain-containing protein [Cephaloticoccus sp.]|nr:twin-arginine translocation signal domain-containing protein [Cephaloticoccus sp.]MCF7759333.1 twin-arginine translocation signal domain-containing protein [Cephaloticoccus sp.]